MLEVLRSVVLPFCANTSDSTRTRMTMSEHTSLESAKTLLRALTGQFAHQTEGPTHNNGIEKPPASRCSVAGDIDADSLGPNRKNYSEYAKPLLVLICR